VEEVQVKVFLSSQGSQKVNVEESSLVYPSAIRAYTLPILRLEEGANPGSLEACDKFFSMHP
jgi:hypothetical protein